LRQSGRHVPGEEVDEGSDGLDLLRNVRESRDAVEVRVGGPEPGERLAR
jgi:hypothetical protein